MLTNQYFAGLFDGEGSISILRSKAKNGRKYHKLFVQLCVCNNKALMDEIQLTYGGWVWELNRKTTSGHTAYKWAVQNKEAEGALLAILPYLHIKREVALCGLEFIPTLSYEGKELSADTWTLRDNIKARVEELNAKD